MKAGVTQEQAAEHLGCGTRTIQRYEAGETKPKMDRLCAMKECYSCEFADLFAGGEKK